MTDLLHVLPGFDLTRFSHILPSLERALITTNDLLTLDAIDVAKRAQVPPAEVGKLIDEILRQLYLELGLAETINGTNDSGSNNEHGHNGTVNLVEEVAFSISTLDESLDASLGGGFPTGYLSEVTGER